MICVFIINYYTCDTLCTCIGPEGEGKSVRQLRNLLWAKKNDVFDSTHVLLKKFEATSKELESTLKEWLGENVHMRKMSERGNSSKKPKPKYNA